MWYLVVEKSGEETQLFEGDRDELVAVKRQFEARGWTANLLDEEDRRRFADLTAKLLEAHPDLAV